MLGRAIGIALLAASVVPACSGSSVPGFCGVSDDVRVAIAGVDPAQYPAEAAKHVQELRDAAADLTGTEGTLARQVAGLLEEASKTQAGSLEFTGKYNDFVRASNEFNHRYCNATNAPDV